MRVVYLVNLMFKDCFLINASADIHITIHRYVAGLIYVLQQPRLGDWPKEQPIGQKRALIPTRLVAWIFLKCFRVAYNCPESLFPGKSGKHTQVGPPGSN